MSSLRDALEAALVEDPDDRAAHMAYADYLQEQGDPRGEFIQVQLALEDPERTAEQRQRLQAREQALLAELRRGRLGDFARAVFYSREGGGQTEEIHFARGWLDRCVLGDTGSHLARELARLLARDPDCRLLRELVLECDVGAVEQLIRSPFLGNLRLLQLGAGFETLVHSVSVPEFVAKLPRLEELHLHAYGYDPVRLFTLSTLRELRVLKIYCQDLPYPLELLAGNPSLRNLTHLLLRPLSCPTPLINLAGVRAIVQSPHLPKLTHLQVRGSDLGDVGCTEIVTSGVLKKLKLLDLGHGEITDAGARILADCPDLRRLEHLTIDRNGLTQMGIDALRRVLGAKLRANRQQTAEELARQQYLDDSDGE